jgi:hypothetical protein
MTTAVDTPMPTIQATAIRAMMVEKDRKVGAIMALMTPIPAVTVAHLVEGAMITAMTLREMITVVVLKEKAAAVSRVRPAKVIRAVKRAVARAQVLAAVVGQFGRRKVFLRLNLDG